jgi:hypothetical protein
MQDLTVLVSLLRVYNAPNVDPALRELARAQIVATMEAH